MNEVGVKRWHMKYEFSKIAIQLVAAMTAYLVGEFVAGALMGIPLVLRCHWVSTVIWAAMALSYLIPRFISRNLVIQISACVLCLLLLTFAKWVIVIRLQYPVSLAGIVIPLPAFFVLCVSSFILPPPHSPLVMAIIVCPAIVILFLSLLWAYGFGTSCGLGFSVAQLIPFSAAAGVLVVTDNFGVGSGSVGVRL